MPRRSNHALLTSRTRHVLLDTTGHVMILPSFFQTSVAFSEWYVDISKFSLLSLMFSAVFGQLGKKLRGWVTDCKTEVILKYRLSFKDGGDVNDVYRYLGCVYFTVWKTYNVGCMWAIYIGKILNLFLIQKICSRSFSVCFFNVALHVKSLSCFIFCCVLKPAAIKKKGRGQKW